MLNYKKYSRSAEEFSAKCAAYFAACDAENAAGRVKKPYTVSGLCFFLGIGKDELEKLEKKRTHAQVCRAALLKIESFIEENALLGVLANTPALYALKYNFGWTDKPKKDDGDDARSVKITFDGECDKWAD